jgi:hypothetical protein
MTMATQLATTEDQPKAPAKVAVTAGGKLAAFVPNSLEEAWRLAGALAASGMTPKAYGGDQNKIMVGIIAGAEVGLTPFAALQSIAVIGNNPSLWGDGALALVQASGLLDDMEETDDGNTATCRLNRQGRKTAIVRTFSMEDAKKAGLAGKAGPWTQYPARMRQMRARAFALRDGFSDVLKGLHIAEEARDYSSMGAAVPTSAPLSAAMIIDQSRIGQAETNDGTLEPGNPVASEGPSDDQRGEQHNDTDTSAADDLIARIGAAAIIGDVIGIESSYQSDGGRDMFETLDQDRIETAIAEAKARLKGGAK